ncbi:hypothetical protein ACTOB_007262 [Actinoplanes oblitus]|uniref:Secreted protein n=1 Tax=Actinoplanes oblitus TaxID=3040509 RepID=A0ABY8WFB4_9ACTN|nr:hypothetical protein [Actinoplanes oblitus]WIM95188.1 hypothetical protein ACTOB_007262 [Actinoplanes oblitus]
MRPHTQVLVAVTGATMLALTGCGSSTGSTTATGQAPAAVTRQATSTTPTSDPGDGKPAATPTSDPGDGKPAATPTSDPGDGGCPAPAATLEKLMKLDAGHRIDKSSIKCSQGWAVAGVITADKSQQGDGKFLFEFANSTGRWTVKGEGSSFDCATQGIPRSTGFCG